MRVLHVLARAHRRGAETFGWVLHHELLARGVPSAIVALAPAPDPSTALPVPVLGGRPRSPRALRALRREASQVDVVVAHGSSTLAACRLALLAGSTPFVYVNIGDPLHWAASPLRRARVRWMLRGAAAVGAISPTARERLISHLDVAPDRVVVTGNGRRGDDFVPPSPKQRDVARRRFGLPSDGRVAVVVASLSHEKRVDVAIDAAAMNPAWTLLVVGDGPMAKSLQAHAMATCPGRVVFTGSLTDPRDAYRAADVAVLTSQTEGLPGVLIEAALTGLPLVATDVGFVGDIVEEGQNGRLVAAGDKAAIADGIANAFDNRHDWGRTSRDLAERHYELSVVVTRWQELLLSVASGSADRMS